MKKLAALLAILFCCVLLTAAVGHDAPVMPSKNFYVNDYASVITGDHRDAMLQMAQQLYDKTGAQAVVLTVDDLGGRDIESYAFSVFEGWGIGSKGKDNGVLILVAVKDREARIEVGYGLEGALTDIETKHIQEEEMVPRFRDGNYSKGILEAFKRVVTAVYEEYGVEAPEDVAAPQAVSTQQRFETIANALIFFIVAFIIMMRVLRVGSRYRRRYGKGFVYPHRTFAPHRRNDNDDDFPPGFGGPGGFGGFGGFGGGSSGGGGFGGGSSHGGGGHSGGGGSSSKW